MLLLFCIATTLNAFLLFLVQPMFAKMALPLLGGSPAVWTTCMVFFQAALLAGYLYAHASIRLLGVRRQALVHVLLTALPLLVLPVAVTARSRPPESAPIAWLFALMASSVGAPFFLLSTTAPLLQRWFAAARQRSDADPYFLYACSNAGSLAALLIYPTVVEPLISLRRQSVLWAAGYAIGAAAVLGCGLLTFNSVPQDVGQRADGLHPALPIRRRLRWLALAFVPSGLMLAVTSHISTDIAAVPMLWVVPLALYLATFIVAFSPLASGMVRVTRRVLPLALLPLLLLLVAQVTGALWFVVPLHLLTFWVLSLLCHSALAADRPPPFHLTEFYVWMAAGGMLGGVFNTIAAPLLFVRVAEYPILLGAACFVLADPGEVRAVIRHPRALRRPAIAGGAAALVLIAGWRYSIEPGAILPLLGVPALLCFSVSREPARFAFAVAMLLAAGLVPAGSGWGHVLYAERTFFGIYRVTESRDRKFVSLFHGTTVHGSQAVASGDDPEPLTYYYRQSPIADVFAARDPGRTASVGVMGLGVGSLAAYARAGQRWTFYEIDPAVERIARDQRYFRFLGACGSTCRVVLGDGRLAIGASSEAHDVLVLDAFSSDAIPVHLLTREALRVYLSHLTATGVLAFHISNRHFDLQPVLARLAGDQHLVAASRLDAVDPHNPSHYQPSRWVAIGRTVESLGGLAADARWARLTADGGSVWTDDFSNVWSVLHWR